MNGFKFLEIIENLNGHEKNRFRKYLDSPYFNTDQTLVSLYEHILQHIPDHDLTREQLDHFLHPGQVFNYDRITNYLSYLTRHAEDFLALERMRKDPFQLRFQTMLEARDRDLGQVFRDIDRRFEKEFSNSDFQDERDFYRLQLVDDARNTYALASEQRIASTHLDNRIEHIQQYYLTSMLKSVCQLFNQGNVIQSGGGEVKYGDFVDYMGERIHRYSDQPCIRLYYLVLMTLWDGDNVEHYYSLRNLLVQWRDILPPDERSTIIQYAQNYCIKQSNRGNVIFLEELFDWYKIMLEDELIYYQGKISPLIVKNIVTLGVRLEKFDWTEKFLSEIALRISPEFRDNTMKYNLAYLHHGKGEPEAALRFLREAEFRDVYYDLGARTLLLKIYFELDEQEGFYSLVHSFRIFLRRNKLISSYQRKVHLNLIKFTSRLNTLRVRAITQSPSVFRLNVQKLKSRIETTREITNINWLLARLEELVS